MIKNCSCCYYREQCAKDEVCNDYYPCNEGFEDEIINEQIEQERNEHYKAWFKYVGEDNTAFYNIKLNINTALK